MSHQRRALPKEPSTEVKAVVSNLYQHLASNIIISDAQFTSPQTSSDHESITVEYSQRDLLSNAFKKWKKSFTQTRSSTPSASTGYSGSSGLQDTSAAYAQRSPSGQYSLHLAQISPPNAAASSTTKHTTLQVYDTATNMVVTTSLLDGLVCMGTPFQKPSFSPCERFIMFSFLHSSSAKQLEAFIKDYHQKKEAIDTQQEGQAPSPASPSDTKHPFQLTVDSLLTDIFTDNRYSFIRDNGEQMTGINYPYLVIYDVLTGSLQPVHHPTLYSVLMPTQAEWGPAVNGHLSSSHVADTFATITASDPSHDSVKYYQESLEKYTHYSILFTAMPIFPFRLGTIFYTSRPSRLYTSIVSLKNSVTNESRIKGQSQLVPSPHHLHTPFVFCLTPDSHAVWSPSISPVVFGTPANSDVSTPPDSPELSDDIDITFLEGVAYDDRWGLCDTNRHLGLSLTSADTNEQPTGSASQGRPNVRLLSPHGTTQALRLLRMTRTEYSSIMVLLYVLNTVQQVYIEQSSNSNARTSISELFEQLQLVYRSALPQLYYQSGGSHFDFVIHHSTSGTQPSDDLRTIDRLLENHPIFASLHTTALSFNTLQSSDEIKRSNNRTISLLPVNMQSYGVYSTPKIHRLSPHTIAIQSTIRDADCIYIIQYRLDPADISQTKLDGLSNPPRFLVKLHVVVPESSTEEAYSTYQYNSSPLSSASVSGQEDQTTHRWNKSPCPPLVSCKDGDRLDSVSSASSGSVLPTTRITHHGLHSTLIRLPVATKLTPGIARTRHHDSELRSHTTVSTLSLLDTRAASLLVTAMLPTSPPSLHVVQLHPSILDPLPFGLSNATKQPGVYYSTPLVYSNQLQFHNDPNTKDDGHRIPCVFDAQNDYYPAFISSTAASSSGNDAQWTTVTSSAWPAAISPMVDNIINETCDVSAYNAFGQNQALVSYHRHLRFDSHTESDKTDDKAATQTQQFSQDIILQALAASPLSHALSTKLSLPAKEADATTPNEGSTHGAYSPLFKGFILFPHGGPHSGFTSMFDFASTLFAILGYVVLKINYSGSTGYGEVSNRSLLGYIGLIDVTDCLHAYDTIVSSYMPRVFPSHSFLPPVSPAGAFNHMTYIYGGSHGGYLGASLMLHRDFTGCIIRNPVLSLALTAGTSDIVDWGYNECGYPLQTHTWWLDTTTNDDSSETSLSSALIVQSPMTNIHLVNTPTLLGIGLSDRRVPCLQSFTYQSLLQQRNVPCILYQYPNAQHGLNDTPHIHAHSLCSSIIFMLQFTDAHQSS